MLKIAILIASALMVLSTASAYGQFSVGATPQQNIKITIYENGTAHVVHEVEGNATSAVHVGTVSGNLTNLSVSDEAGNPVQYSTISQTPVAVMLLPTQRNFTIISYDLPNAVANDSGVWKWDYFTPIGTKFTDFYFPTGVHTVWVLSDDKEKARPVYIQKGLRQLGNGVHLAYTIGEPETVQTVQWQGQTFNVGVTTFATPGPAAFDQSSKAYAFDVDKPGSFVTVLMPKALLWGPYQGSINAEPTLTTEFHENDTYSWIGMMPLKSGTLQISGATAIPEFPMYVPLAIAISAVVALRFAGRLGFH